MRCWKMPSIRGLNRVFADERAIKQILVNLLSNAVKFTPEQGRITVFAHRITGGGLMFGVSDTGIGISAQDQQKVFDSFGQGKHDIAIADKGTGLGLAIVKGLAESHGGRVVLESQVGRGTTVTVHLPACTCAAGPARTFGTGPFRRLKKLRRPCAARSGAGASGHG